MADFFDTLWFDHILGWLWPLIQFLIGLNVVVFVHELGHYLAARWAGVKVERFALGMGPRLFGFHKGDTDYCICAFPVGGYVKMLGQDDFNPRDEEKEMVSDEEDLSKKVLDKRSYNAATPGKRLVIISAGVVMNLILAAIMFVALGMVGKDFPAPVVGAVAKDYPAANCPIVWENNTAPPANPKDKKSEQTTGLKPGDKIVTINGTDIDTFAKLKMQAVLSYEGDKFDVVFERNVNGKTYRGTTVIGTKPDPQKMMPIFGISPAYDTKVINSSRDLFNTPFKDGDKITAINGKPVSAIWQIRQIERTLNGKPVEVSVTRKANGKTEDIKLTITPELSNKVIYTEQGLTVNPAKLKAKDDSTFTYGEGKDAPVIAKDSILQSTGLDILGLTPRTTVSRIVRNSPAYKAGVKPDDIITSYADTRTPSNPRFIELSNELKGARTNLTVLRDGKPVSMEIQAQEKDGRYIVGIVQSVDYKHLIVGSVRENSIAAKAGIPAGAKITAVGKTKVTNWQQFFEALKAQTKQAITISAEVAGKPQTFNLGKIPASKFDPANDYEYEIFNIQKVNFGPLSVMIQHSNPMDALSWGCSQTGDLILQTYSTLRAMICGTVAPKAMSGPVGIGQAGVAFAKKSPMDLFYLIAIISASLAVFNFLPIPVLDGGHAVLIIIEWIRGKPLPIKLVNTIQIIGLVLILGLFVTVTFMDIMKIVA